MMPFSGGRTRMDSIAADVLERLTDASGLGPDVQEIRADIQANEEGSESVLVSVGLVSSFDIDKPSADVGRKLNSIASAIRARSEALRLSTVISFYKQEQA
jgi:hypothetical protein